MGERLKHHLNFKFSYSRLKKLFLNNIKIIEFKVSTSMNLISIHVHIMQSHNCSQNLPYLLTKPPIYI